MSLDEGMTNRHVGSPSHRRSRSHEQAGEGDPFLLAPGGAPPLALPSPEQFLSNLVPPGGTPEGASQAGSAPATKPPLPPKGASGGHEVPVSLFALQTAPFPSDSDDEEAGADSPGSPRSVVGQASETPAALARQASRAVPGEAVQLRGSDSAASIARQPSRAVPGDAVQLQGSEGAAGIARQPSQAVPGDAVPQLHAQLARLTHELAQAKAAWQHLHAELASARGERDAAQMRLDCLMENLTKATQDTVIMNEMKRDLHAARQAALDATANLRRAEERAREQEARAAGLEESLARDRAGAAEGTTRLAGLERVVDDISGKLRMAEAERDKYARELQAVQRQQGSVADVSRKLREAEAERDMYVRELQAVQQQQGSEDEAAALRKAYALRNEDLQMAADERDAARKLLAEVKADVERLSACLGIAQRKGLPPGSPGDQAPLRLSLVPASSSGRSGSLGTVIDRHQIAARSAEQGWANPDRLRQLGTGGGPQLGTPGDRGTAELEQLRAELHSAIRAAASNVNHVLKDLETTREEVTRLQAVEQELEALRQESGVGMPMEVRSSPRGLGGTPLS